MRRLWKRLLVLPVSTLMIITLAGFGDSVAAQGGLGDGTAPELEGTWRTTVSLSGLPGGDPPPLEGVLHSFTRGGVVLISIPLGGQSTAHGVWTRLGPRRFGFTVELFWYNPATGQLAGKTKVKEIIELNQKCDEYQSVESSAVDYYVGGPTIAYCARTHGRRMNFERPDPCR